MKTCAVIGNPIEHSLSPLIHQHFASQCGLSLDYQKRLGDDNHFEQQVNQFFANGGTGLNVTVPFKERAFTMAEITLPEAAKAQAANTLWLNKAGKLCADNTDGLGLITALEQLTILKDKRILLIGGGGAAQAVIPNLLKMQPMHLTLTNRTLSKLQPIAERYSDITITAFESLKPEFDLIINATSASISQQCPKIPDNLYNNSLCLDMFYDRSGQTVFTQHALKQGAQKALDGFMMLVSQAALSFKIWHNYDVDIQKTLAELHTVHS